MTNELDNNQNFTNACINCNIFDATNILQSNPNTDISTNINFIVYTVCEKGYEKILKLLYIIKPNLSSTFDNNYAFKIACANGHFLVVELLLKHGKSKVGMKNEWNSTALSIAKRKQYHHIIELLEPLHPYERHISPYELLFHHSYSGIINVIKDVLSLLGIPTEFLDTLTSVKTGEAEDGL